MKIVEFSRIFTNEEDCKTFLKEQWERKGMVCPKCGCKKMYWFTAIYLLTSTKKIFSALEMQRQLGHKRYQPIWEMMHNLHSVMGQCDSHYKLTDTIELDEGYFTTESFENQDNNEKFKQGIGSQRKSKVLVMMESKDTDDDDKPRKGKLSPKCCHIKMKVMENLSSLTFGKGVKDFMDSESTVIMDALHPHLGVENVVKNSKKQVESGKDAPKVLPWVYIAISNAKSMFTDMHHD